jgi:hypothetical protein
MFAQPLSKLAQSGIGVAAAPTGGMGLALDDKGQIPVETLPTALAYTEFTTDITVSGSEATPTDIASTGAIQLDGRSVWVEFHVRGVQTSATASDFIVISLWDDTTDLGRWGIVLTPAAAAMIAPMHLRRLLTPTAGQHNYKARAWKGTNNGTVLGTGIPGFIMVTKHPL